MGIVVVSRYFPPAISGTPSVLHALLKKINPKSFTTVTREIGFREKTDDRTLNCDKIEIRYPEWIERSVFLRVLFMPFYIVDIFLKILQTVQKKNASVIFAIFPDITFLVMTYFANKLSKKPLVVYFHDTLLEQQKNPIIHAIICKLEKRILAMATEVIVLNESLRALFMRKGIDAKIIRNTIDLGKSGSFRHECKPNEKKLYRIVFTGSIYGMNLDAIKSAIIAFKNLENQGIEFIISTPTSMTKLSKMGIDIEPHQLMFFEGYTEYLQFISQADLLFLPLAFNPPYPQETQTVLPQKTIDYMVAKVPILVLSPDHYYLSKYAKHEGFAYVVNTNCVDAIQEAILNIKSDKELQQRIVEASQRTLKKHDPDFLAGRLIEIIRNARESN